MTTNASHDIGSWRLTTDGKIYRRWRQYYPSGDFYDGEWVNGLRQGKGSFVYKNGDSYVGEFDSGLYEGYGTLIRAAWQHPFTKKWRGKEKYEGEFLQGKKHGKGSYVVDKKLSYEGHFLEDRRDGNGLCRYVNGTEYEGEWKNDQWHGIGRIEYRNGVIYDGEISYGSYHGLGSLIYPRGTGQYTGAFIFGEKEGSDGMQIFRDGTMYRGEYKKNEIHGEGVITYRNGARYKGEFQEGKPSGYGILIHADGSIYEGQMLSGYYYGKGKLLYSGGGYYEGEYLNRIMPLNDRKRLKQDSIRRNNRPRDSNRNNNSELIKGGPNNVTTSYPAPNGQRHGYGVRVFSTGNVYEGNWINDRMEGLGKLSRPDGITTEGMFVNGKPQGKNMTMKLVVEEETQKGIEFPPGSNLFHRGKGLLCIYEGEMQLGEWHGEGRLTQKNGQNYEGNWRRGKRHGHGKQVYTVVDPDFEGKMVNLMMSSLYQIHMYRGNFHENTRHGKGEIFYANGDCIKGSFSMGHLEGICTYVFGKSKRTRVGEWKRGTRIRWLEEEEVNRLDSTRAESKWMEALHSKETVEVQQAGNSPEYP